MFLLAKLADLEPPRSSLRSIADGAPWLDAPMQRVGSTFTPVGFNRILERAILPNTEKVLAAARKVLAY